MKKPASNKYKFLDAAFGLIITVGVLVALFMPEISAWRLSVVDRLLAQANTAREDSQRYSLLQQANLIGYKDPVATEAMAQYWIRRGEQEQAIAVYQRGITQPNYIALGNLALSAQNYSQAQKLFATSNKESPTDASLVGEAIAQYNLGNIEQGCNDATQANKFNLNSTKAKAAISICSLLGGTPKESVGVTPLPAMSERETAYFLINNQVYKLGEAKLEAVPSKVAPDWLLLASLAASRGELDDAIGKAEQGIALDRSNSSLNELLVKLYSMTSNTNKANEYSNRLEQLKFVKYSQN